MTGVLILGAGGHAKVVADILLRGGVSVAGFLDDDPALWNSLIWDLPVLGSIHDYAAYDPGGLVLAVGSSSVRQLLAHKLKDVPASLWITAIHPQAVVAPSARVGPGTVVAAGAVINPDAIIGQHAIINTGATVDHDCHIHDFAHIAPGAHLAGGVQVGSGTLVGVGANVIPGVMIGASVTVGAGAVVVKDIPDGVTARGVPARWS